MKRLFGGMMLAAAAFCSPQELCAQTSDAGSGQGLSAEAMRIFSTGVPFGGAIMRASGGPDAKTVSALTDRKIAENRESIAKIALAMDRMVRAKGAGEAEKAMTAFKSDVKAYLKKFVSGYGSWPLVEWEVVGEKSQTARSCVEAMSLVLARTKDDKVKAVYEKHLAQMSRQAEKLEAKYRELCPVKPAPAEATTRASPKTSR